MTAKQNTFIGKKKASDHGHGGVGELPKLGLHHENRKIAIMFHHILSEDEDTPSDK